MSSIIREYKKKAPFRDATLFVIVCEGQKRESDYFDFFDRLSSRIKVVSLPCKQGRSAPKYLIRNAENYAKNSGLNSEDELWFVLDVDKWKKNDIDHLINYCKKNKYYALSNPCFEVWLYYHFKDTKPQLKNISECTDWKRHLPEVISGGFDSNKHPREIQTAIVNAKNIFSEKGYLPDVGCTQVFRLAEKIYNLIRMYCDFIFVRN